MVLLLISSLFSSAQQLSPQAKASLLTCGAGDDLYSVFGHSALRIQDPARDLDIVFNYGTFDFDAPNFYLKFARGKLDYILSISTFSNFMRGYVYEERYVYEQDLNLSQADLDELFVALQVNYLPENRAYRYDFFYDNCSTRIRDLLKKVLGDRLDYHESAIEPVDKSFRDCIDEYTFNVPWGDFGIDLALGMPTDQQVSGFHLMFLPEYLKDAFDRATLEGEPLVADARMLLDLPRRTPSFQWFTPAQLLWLFFIVTAFLAYKRKLPLLFDRTLFAVIGLLGIAILLLWFATDHTATANNLNILWALPTWLLLAFAPRNSAFENYVARFHMLVLIALLLSWLFLPQALHYALVPLVLVLVIRLLPRYTR